MLGDSIRHWGEKRLCDPIIRGVFWLLLGIVVLWDWIWRFGKGYCVVLCCVVVGGKGRRAEIWKECADLG